MGPTCMYSSLGFIPIRVASLRVFPKERVIKNTDKTSSDVEVTGK